MTVKYWLGAAVPVPQKTYFELSGTFATGDTITCKTPSSGNTKELVLTVGTTTTIDQILADLVDMVNGDDANGDETRSAIGTSVGEWNQLTATADTTNDYIYFTGKSDGRPFTISLTTSGSGVIATPSPDPSVTGSGPSHFSTVGNWSGNTVPVDSDDIVFDHHAAADLKYELSQTSLEPSSVAVEDSFRYAIGLPSVNADSTSLQFNESLDQYLEFGVTAAIDVTINSTSARNIRIDTNTQVASVVVSGSGSSDETGVPPVLLRGNNASNEYNITGGDVGLWFESGTAGNAANIRVGSGEGVRPKVQVGDAATLTSCDVSMSAGEMSVRTPISTADVYGGSLTTELDATIGTCVVDGGELFPNGAPSSGAAITTLEVSSGGSIDCSQDLRSKTFTNVSMYSGASFKDPNGIITATNGFDIYATLNEVTLSLPPRRTYTVGAI